MPLHCSLFLSVAQSREGDGKFHVCVWEGGEGDTLEVSRIARSVEKENQTAEDTKNRDGLSFSFVHPLVYYSPKT